MCYILDNSEWRRWAGWVGGLRAVQRSVQAYLAVHFAVECDRALASYGGAVMDYGLFYLT